MFCPPALPPAPDLTGSRSILHAAHIASYRERELAQQGWLVFSQSEAFEGLRARVEPVELDSGSWLRLKAGPFDDAEQVRQFCEPIRSRGDWCAITDFSGDPVDNSTD